MRRVIFITLLFASVLRAALSDGVLGMLLPPDGEERLLALSADTPRLEASLWHDYNLLYRTRERGALRDDAATTRSRFDLIHRGLILRLGLSGTNGSSGASTHTDQGYFSGSAGESFLSARAAVVWKGLSLGAQTDPDFKNRGLFLRAAWKGFGAYYLHGESLTRLHGRLSPEELLGRTLRSDLSRKKNKAALAWENHLLRTGAYLSVESFFADSTLKTPDGMSSRLYHLDTALGAACTVKAPLVKPFAQLHASSGRGYFNGFYHDVPYGALEALSLRYTDFTLGAGVPRGFSISYFERRFDLQSPGGYLEATPFNVLNLFTHSYYRILNSRLRCEDRLISLQKHFKTVTPWMEATVSLGYDLAEIEGELRYKEREYILYIIPTYGPEKTLSIVEFKDDFIYVDLKTRFRVRRVNLFFEWEQFLPVPDFSSGPASGGGPPAAEVRTLGGTRIRLGAELGIRN